MSNVDMNMNQSSPMRGLFQEDTIQGSKYNFTVVYWFLSLMLSGLMLRFVCKNYVRPVTSSSMNWQGATMNMTLTKDHPG